MKDMSHVILELCLDSCGASKMLRRDHQHWIRCLQDPWFTLVQISVLVLSSDIQLLLLWGKSSGLFWSCRQPNGLKLLIEKFEK